MVTKESRKQTMQAIMTRGLRWPQDITEEHRQIRINRQLVGKGYRAIRDWTPVEGRHVLAYVNHSRWVADCPEDGCQGTEFVDGAWPRFVCISCGSGVWRVVFPKDRLAIEALLLTRPEEENRNWSNGEDVADLKAENDANQKGEDDGLDSA